MAVNRREVIVGSAVATTALLAGCFKRRPAWEFLSEAEAGTLAALCDQIIPADDFPSASQAGVLHFIDRQLVRRYAKHQAAYREGLARVNALCIAKCGVELASAPAARQLEIARAIEQQSPDFFELVRRHTFQGFYGSPRHGGNRDAVSWRMLGLDEPPLRGRAQYDLSMGKQS